MTQPAQASRGRGMRVYKWPPQPPHELEVVSVTSILGNGIPKPFLAPWSAKMVAEYAVEAVEEWAPLAAKDPKAVIDLLKRSPYRFTSEKAAMGTVAHSAMEAYIDGKPLTDAQLEEMLKEKGVPLKKWKATRGYIAAAMEFLFDQEPEILHSEATVYSREHGYAGTADLVMRMRVGDSIKPVIGDFKTSKSIYDEVGLQLCAYSRADFVGLNDGTEKPLCDEPIRDGVAIHLMPSGKYNLVPFTLTDELFNVFLSAKGVATGKDVIKQSRRPGF